MHLLSVKSMKKVKNEQNSLKTADKSVSTSFRVRAAPKSWSKYTTDNADESVELNN